MRIRSPVLLILPAGMLVTLASCREQELPELVEEPVEQVRQTTAQMTDQIREQIKEKIPQGGAMELSIAIPSAGAEPSPTQWEINTGRCYVSLTRLTDGRRSVLQITSYRSAGDESFPAVFFRAEVDADALPELAGRTLSGLCFMQAMADGPVWHSRPQEPVQVTITQATDQGLTGELVGGRLVDSKTGRHGQPSGTFTAELR